MQDAPNQAHQAPIPESLRRQLDAYRRIREVVEKIRYGQYL